MKVGRLFLLALPVFLHAELTWQAKVESPFEITLKLPSQHITQGDFLELEADFHYPSFYQLNSDALVEQLTWSANPLNPSWSLVHSNLSSRTDKEIQMQHFEIQITPLSTGSLDLSLLTVTFEPKDSSHAPVHVVTPLFSVEVIPWIAPKTALPLAPLLPLEPQFPLSLTQSNRELLIENPQKIEAEKQHIQRYLENHSFPWLTLIFLIGGGGVGWAAYLTRDRWFKRRVKPVKVIPPPQQARQALEALQQRHLPEQSLMQTYYAELSSILLKFLQEQEKWKTKELTSTEVAQGLNTSPLLSDTQKQEILALLKEMDQVKFAGKTPSQEEAYQLYENIQTWIQSFS